MATEVTMYSRAITSKKGGKANWDAQSHCTVALRKVNIISEYGAILAIFFTRNNWSTCLKFCENSVWIPVCMYAKGGVWMAIISCGF